MRTRAIHRRTLLLGIAAAALAGPATAQATTFIDNGGGSSVAYRYNMAPAAYKALVAKSKLLNARYSSYRYNMTPSAYRALVAESKALNAHDASYRFNMSPAAYKELLAEGQALNARYANPVVTDGRSGFQWDDLGIGIGAALGVVLLLVALNRRNRRGRSDRVVTA
jgi:hypothetical protein